MRIDLDTYKQALAHYRITADNLYVVFADMLGSAESLGFQVASSFILSHEGQAGVDAIAEGNRHWLLGCASLSTMRVNHQHLQNTPLHIVDEDRLAGLWKANTFFVLLVPRQPSDHHVTHSLRVRAFTTERIVAWAAEQHPQYTVAVTGSQEDYDSLLARMEDIVAQQDFKKIDGEVRKTFEGVDAKCLLSTKKEPSSIDIDLFVANNYEIVE